MTRQQRLAILAGNKLARALEAVERAASALSWRLKRCETCGENIYYGKPCPPEAFKRT